MAHRDDTGVGPGRERQRLGHRRARRAGARLRTLADARGRARPLGRTRSSSSPPTAAPYGGARRGAVRRAPAGADVIAVDQPRRDRRARAAAARDRRRHAALAARASLVETAARARRSSRPGAGRAARRASAPARSTSGSRSRLYEQAPFVARGIPAVTITTAGERPPDGFTDRRRALDGARLGAARPGDAGRSSARSTQGVALAQGRRATSTSAAASSAAGRSSCVLVGAAAPVRRRRRRSLRPLPAAADPARARRCAATAAGSASGSGRRRASSTLFALLGAWPGGAPRPPSLRRASAGDWHVLALLGLGVARRAGLARRARSGSCRGGRSRAEEMLAGQRRRCSRSASSRCSSWRRTRSRSIFVLPVAARLALAAAGAERARSGTRRSSSPSGFAGPALLLWSFASRLRARARRAVVPRSSSPRSATCRVPGSRSPSAGAAARRSSSRSPPAATRRTRAPASGRRAARSASTSGAIVLAARGGGA